jgi:hypothetical protein
MMAAPQQRKRDAYFPFLTGLPVTKFQSATGETACALE